jgi:hypothetical protein
MRGCLVTLCVAIAVALLTGCESTKSPKHDRTASDPTRVAAPIPDGSAKEKVKPDDVKPAIADVPEAPLAMEKLEDAGEGEEVEEEDFSAATVFPDRLTPDDALPEKMAKRIRYKLREVAKAPIALRGFIRSPNPDGSLEVFAIYEYSAYEDCVRSYATRKEGREQCRQHLSNGGCVGLGAVRAHFGKPKAGATFETSGSLAVSSMAFADTLCTVSSEVAFVDDVDRDGKLEMVIDEMTTYYVSGDRSPDEYSYKRQLFIFPGTDGTGDFERVLDSWMAMTSRERSPSIEVQVQWPDLNRDGHPDLLVSEVPDCANDLMEGWTQSEEKEAECEKQPRKQTAYLFDKGSDEWNESAEMSAAKTAAAERAMKAAADAAALEEPAAATNEEKNEEKKEEKKEDAAGEETRVDAGSRHER